ncbi:MAG: T9SS type A sorting domain-containing protein [Paludibacteraceae bacterium]
MKNKLHVLPGLVLMFFLLISTSVNSQTYSLSIRNIDGTVKEISLPGLNKITFENSNVNLMYSNFTSEVLPIVSIQKMLFSTATKVQLAFETSLSVYPNPATSYIIIKNRTISNEPIKIFSISGAFVKSFDAKALAQNIDVSNLPKGLYFIRVNNKVLKFIKL